MDETGISRRGIFAHVFGGLAALLLFRHPPAATPCAAEEPSFERGIGATTTTYTYDQQARLLNVTTYESGKATIIAI